jgi:hypothetical protein
MKKKIIKMIRSTQYTFDKEPTWDSFATDLEDLEHNKNATIISINIVFVPERVRKVYRTSVCDPHAEVCGRILEGSPSTDVIYPAYWRVIVFYEQETPI